MRERLNLRDRTRDCVTDRDRQIYYFRPNSVKKLFENIVVILVDVESCYLHVLMFLKLQRLLACLFYQSFHNF